MRCRRHGVVVCAVPWARHGSRFTRSFEDQVAWLAVNCSKTAVSQLMRIAWRTVGGICERVAEEAAGGRDLLAGLTRIGIDEISHRKGQRYLTVVVDHDTGRLVWAAPGRDRKTTEAFLDRLGEERCKQLELVSCDMASWITGPVAERCPNAELCLDPFHVVQLATKALDEIRREVWNQARREGLTALAGELKDARFALWKNPENLTARQEVKLARIEQANRPLFRAYLLKEQLRQIYRIPAAQAAQLLERWLRLGETLPPATVREARQDDHRPESRDPRRDQQRPLQRPRRSHQHPNPTDHPTRVRLPHTRSAHRPRDALTRWTLPTPAPMKRPTETSGDSFIRSPEGLSDEQVLFLADILPTAYEVGVLNGRVEPGDTVAIVGAGPIGLAAVMTAKLHTPGRIVSIDLADARLEKALEFGADVTINNGDVDAVAKIMELTGGLGADVAIEAVGVPSTFELCTELIRPGGRVANVGVHGKCVTLHLEKLWIRDVMITTGLVDTNTTPKLLKLIEGGRLDPTPFATHRFPLDETEQAYDVFAAAAETHAFKVVLEATPVTNYSAPRSLPSAFRRTTIPELGRSQLFRTINGFARRDGRANPYLVHATTGDGEPGPDENPGIHTERKPQAHFAVA